MRQQWRLLFSLSSTYKKVCCLRPILQLVKLKEFEAFVFSSSPSCFDFRVLCKYIKTKTLTMFKFLTVFFFLFFPSFQGFVWQNMLRYTGKVNVEL